MHRTWSPPLNPGDAVSRQELQGTEGPTLGLVGAWVRGTPQLTRLSFCATLALDRV